MDNISEESQKHDPRKSDAESLHQNAETDGNKTEGLTSLTPSTVVGGSKPVFSAKDDGTAIDKNTNQPSPREEIDKLDQNLSSHSKFNSMSERSHTSGTTATTDSIKPPSSIQVVREDPFKNIRLAGLLAASSASKTKETSTAGALSGQNTSFSRTSASRQV